MKLASALTLLLYHKASCFWEMGTTTMAGNPNEDLRPRQSFFRWQMTYNSWPFWLGGFGGGPFRHWDWDDIGYRRRTHVVCGISIRFTNLGTGVILNRRTVITAANFLEPHKHEEHQLRVWALGRKGDFNTPWRYRVWRTRRLVPRSNNPEHFHGPRGYHVPRHDVSIVHTMDQMYVYNYLYERFAYAARAYRYAKDAPLPAENQERMFFVGSGYEDLVHIRENYKIYFARIKRSDVVDCSKYLPKWWGKFICFRNPSTSSVRIYGVPSGGALLTWNLRLPGIGCFEIRYNEDRILVFTDLRYYFDQIAVYSNISTAEYYEYAYQIWGVNLAYVNDGRTGHSVPFMPSRYKVNDHLGLG